MIYAGNNRTLEILETLISFDTTSYRSNLKLIDYVATYLKQFGIEPKLVFNADKSKANLFATIGEARNAGILLSGHTDVVPVEGQSWSSDPYKLFVKDGKAFGRGTCDMKGFIACVLASIPALISAHLHRPIHIALSYDEEVGCVGVRHLIDFLNNEKLEINACIIGEPSSMKPVTAHTGKNVFRCMFGGTPMHSSLAPEGVNAIAYAGDVIHAINEMSHHVRGKTIEDTRFKHPHPTVNIGEIHGGKAVNIVAEHCAFDVEYRYPPGAEETYFAARLPALIQQHAHGPMSAINQNAFAICEKVVDYPAFYGDFNSPACELARRLTGSNSDLAVNYGTEAGLFQSNGFSSVVCGPGDIDQAHQPDEFISLTQLEKCDRFMSALLEELTSEAALT
jgi:acetylornithine deacetylase